MFDRTIKGNISEYAGDQRTLEYHLLNLLKNNIQLQSLFTEVFYQIDYDGDFFSSSEPLGFSFYATKIDNNIQVTWGSHEAEEFLDKDSLDLDYLEEDERISIKFSHKQDMIKLFDMSTLEEKDFYKIIEY